MILIKLRELGFGSLEPRLLTEEFISRLKRVNKICEHFHLSLQSGCTKTLERMNRKYSKEDIIRVVDTLRENFENAMFTADIIVGFPGETDEEFEETYELLKKIKLYKIHVFQYSKRQGTRAADFENQVDPEVKEIRSRKLIDLSNKMGAQYNKLYLDKKTKVLIEEKEGDFYKGHTKNYMYVLVYDEGYDIRNKEIEAVIEKADEELVGRIAK